MRRIDQTNWKPSPTMLAAYADGEFECRDDLASLKSDIETYLTNHPAAVRELAEYRSLRKLWRDTTPSKPSLANWDAVYRGVRRGEATARRRSSDGKRWQLWTGFGAAAIVMFATAAIWFSSRIADPQQAPPVTQNQNIQTPRLPEEIEVEPLPVASMEEVEILSVDGEDIPTLIVGILPVEGLIEPADAGDVSDFHIFDSEGNIVIVNNPDERPMVIAQID